MSEFTLPSGLVVRDHRRASEFPQIEPRDHLPNANGEGPNTPPQSVGPTSSEGFGNTHVMVPSTGGAWHAEAWSGWPVEWDTPWTGPGWGDWSGYGCGRQNPGDLWARVSTAMTCVDLNSRQLGSFPVYGVKGSTPFELPPWHENPEPELYECWVHFMHAAVNSLLLRGEVITYATGRYASPAPGVPGRIARFATLNPDVVDVEFIDGRRVVSLAGSEIPSEDVMVVRYQVWPGRMRGITPLEWCGQSIATSSALESYASGLATRGGVPWAVLKHRSNINANQAETAQARWVSARQRADGAPAVLGGDFDLVPVNISPRDMALLELREFDERRICAAFGVPAYLVNVAMASGLTYANAQSLFTHHWQATLRPLANMLACAWSAWLLPRGSRMEFNPDRYVQPPLGERVQAWQTLFNLVDPATGERAMSLREIRAAERLEPLPDLIESDEDAERMTGAVV